VRTGLEWRGVSPASSPQPTNRSPSPRLAQPALPWKKEQCIGFVSFPSSLSSLPVPDTHGVALCHAKSLIFSCFLTNLRFAPPAPFPATPRKNKNKIQPEPAIRLLSLRLPRRSFRTSYNIHPTPSRLPFPLRQSYSCSAHRLTIVTLLFTRFPSQ
jgi:hypothetical protein